MSTLLGVHSLTKAHGTQSLFTNLSFTVHTGDKIGIIGPNGTGKSTLLRILADRDNPDTGSVSRRQGLRIGYVPQESSFEDLPIESILLADHPGDDNALKAKILLSKVGFENPQQTANQLSGGWKKRLDIARALMDDPELLLLDEPTNHLDLEGIVWLENFLNRAQFAYLLISHDRYFLEKTTNKIIELDRCYPQGMFVVEGNYSVFVERKEGFLVGQKEQERSLASKARTELDWLRRSPKARTTKAQSRVQGAERVLEELADIKHRNKKPRVDLEFAATERETRKLLVAKNISKTLGDKQLFKNVDVTLSPGSRLGIVGVNGSGKTTLLKIMAGEITPDVGTVKLAEDLKLVYFDQHRAQVPMNATLREALSPNSDVVTYHGRSIHVNGWAKRFLFSPDRLELPVKYLSGGERARISIARLMLEPADILFLDEPTNDLDIGTLEVIEESLKEFPGAIVLISHDRCLMDRLCTGILGLGTGNEAKLFADYSQWETSLRPVKVKEDKPKTTQQVQSPQATTAAKKKLSWKEQQELEKIPAEIEKLEKKIQGLHAQLEDPSVASNGSRSMEIYTELGQIQTKLDSLFNRWEELEN